MTTLNPLAVANAPLLRELAATNPDDGQRTATVSDIARVIGRDESNVRKTIKALDAEGLIYAEDRTLTAEGRAQLAAIDRAELNPDEPGSRHTPSSSEAVGPPSDMLALYHAQILPDPANARHDWDSDDARDSLDALREDLLLNGLLQNLVVRPAAPDDLQGVTIEHTDATGTRHTLPIYRLVGGERRWRAIAIAICDGDWPADRTIPCRELDTDDLGCRLAALAENIQRRNLNPIEKARAFDGLAEAGLSNQQIAERIVATPEHVQQHRRFLQLDEADQTRMTLPRDDPRHLSVRDARQKLARKGDDEPAVEITPAARLVLGELAHAARKVDPKSWWIHVVVDSTAVDDPAVSELAALNILEASGPNYQTGEFKAHIRHGGWVFARQLFPWLKDDATDDDRDQGLREMHTADVAVPPPEPGTYVTPWLNGPFALTAEGQAIVAKQAEEEADRQANREAFQREQEARAIRWAAARQRHIELFAEAADKPVWGVPEQTIEIATAIDRPLPWAVTATGKVLDANGREVSNFGHWQGCTDQGLVTARMIVAAVNAAGGLATPAVAAPETDDDDDAEPEQDIDGNDPDADIDDDADHEVAA